jgi:hypothetical protein
LIRNALRIFPGIVVCPLLVIVECVIRDPYLSDTSLRLDYRLLFVREQGQASFRCAPEEECTLASRFELKIEQNSQQLLNHASIAAYVCVSRVHGSSLVGQIVSHVVVVVCFVYVTRGFVLGSTGDVVVP